MMQLPVSHGRLLLIKLIAEMEMFPDILPKYAVAHIHPITPADAPMGLSERVFLLVFIPITFLLTVTVTFSLGCHLDKLHFTACYS